MAKQPDEKHSALQAEAFTLTQNCYAWKRGKRKLLRLEEREERKLLRLEEREEKTAALGREGGEKTAELGGEGGEKTDAHGEEEERVEIESELSNFS